ncbi:UAA transporter [Globomyces pollinis-pini]|nr:UAA transporter [Globomyces pollinis-pini]
MAYKKLAVCVIGIYACFLTWGVTQERVSKTPYDGKKFHYFVFLNIIQSFTATIIAYLYIKLKGARIESLTRERVGQYLYLATLACCAPLFGYASLDYLDYPTVILGKSCKLVPVVLMNFILYRKVFPLKKYLVVLLITIGVSGFMLLHPKKSKGDNEASLYGILLLTINLLIDGAINSKQDQMFHTHKVQGTTMMLIMNSFSFVLMTLYLIVNPYTTELTDAIAFCQLHPKIITDLFLFGIAGALGQCFIFYTLESFGSLVLVTVTVTRKMFSILLSVFWFGHVLSVGQWTSVGLVFFAIGWEAMVKKHKSNSSKQN